MLTDGQLLTASADIRYCLETARDHAERARTAQPTELERQDANLRKIGIRQGFVAHHLERAGHYRREALRIRGELRNR